MVLCSLDIKSLPQAVVQEKGSTGGGGILIAPRPKARIEIGMAQEKQFGEMLDWMRGQQRLGRLRISAEPWSFGPQVTFDSPGSSLPSWPSMTML